jgi:carboxypeptidase Taq
MSNQHYENFKAQLQKIALLSSTAGLSSWDQETHMPINGAELKAQQIGLLSGIIHDMRTDKKIIDITNILMEDKTLTEVQQCNVSEYHRNLQKSLKLSRDFVEEMQSTVSVSYPAWHKAKTENKFEIFAPHLEKIIKLKQEETKLLGYTEHPYDALIDEFEAGLTTQEIADLFSDVKTKLVSYVNKIVQQPFPSDAFFHQNFDKQEQIAFGKQVLQKIGYDFESGRMDQTEHPFCIGLHPNDVRVTYKIKENDLSEIIWGLIHEGGHALYEQGLPADQFGMAAGSAASLAMHESQSRFWENNVGRSASFWKYFLPILKKQFPKQLEKIELNDFYAGSNIVKPSLIRIQADELTYHFHIMIRFEIEKAIIENSVSINEIPQLWNKKYKEYLGLDVPSDSMGVLQDVHWCHGGLGYFPTYSFGSFYAAQFEHTIRKDLDFENLLEKGDLLPVREWLRENIHKNGMQMHAQDLCKKITGEKLNSAYFMQYAENKYNHLYQIN